jgi:hypothetical protein
VSAVSRFPKASPYLGLRLAFIRFVIEAGARENVSIGIVERGFEPSVFTWAPREATLERQLAFEASYKRAVQALIDEGGQ